ncbi:MAG: PPC domain-containing protein [Planctomycetaceae bacterium]
MFRKTLAQIIRFVFSRPRRRSASRSHSVISGLECLEPKQLLSSTGWEPGPNFEQEFNDTPAAADTLAVTTRSSPNADVVITGGIRSVGDVDYYEFTLHSRAEVQLDLYKLHPDLYEFRGDLDLKLENSSGSTIARSIRSGGQPERIETTLDAGTYFARVYLYDASGFGESYQVRLQTDALATTAVPGTSTVTGPADTLDRTPTFTWTSAGNATRYELWVTNRDINSRVIHDGNVTSTRFTPTGEIPEGTYTVWVRAWNGSVPGRWSAGHSFELQETVQRPGVSRVTGPTDTSDTTPEFRWTDAENATHYELWVSNRSIGRRVVLRVGYRGDAIPVGGRTSAGAAYGVGTGVERQPAR